MNSETTKSLVSTAKTLATQYMPAWAIPPDLRWYQLPDFEIADLLRCGLSTLNTLRESVGTRLEMIENLSHYERGDWGTHIGTDSYINPRATAATKFGIDRAADYARLWWIDVFINVHTRPC
jgi:hypothetical protein